jgi:PAS domain S-box-containing protein
MKISNVGNKQHLAVLGCTVVVLLVSISWGASTVVQIKHMSQLWDEELSRTEEINASFRQITSLLGYGGLIHNFKNQILRRDNTYHLQVSEDYGLLIAQLALLETLLRRQEEFREAFIIRQAVEEYYAKSTLAVGLIDEGKTSNEIDGLVQVSDDNAIAAIQSLAIMSNETRVLAISEAKAETQQTLIVVMLGALLLLPIGAGGVVLANITRKQGKLVEALENDAEEMASILDGSLAAVLCIDERGKINIANSAAAALTGYDIYELENMRFDRLIPRPLRDVHGPLERSYLKKPWKKTMASGRDIKILTKMDQQVSAEISLTPIRSKGQLKIIASIMPGLANASGDEKDSNVVNFARQV